MKQKQKQKENKKIETENLHSAKLKLLDQNNPSYQQTIANCIGKRGIETKQTRTKHKIKSTHTHTHTHINKHKLNKN